MNLTDKQIARIPVLVDALRRARQQFLLDRESHYENCCSGDGAVPDEEDRRVLCEMDADIYEIDTILEDFT